jgi:hypothetical protein
VLLELLNTLEGVTPELVIAATTSSLVAISTKQKGSKALAKEESR